MGCPGGLLRALEVCGLLGGLACCLLAGFFVSWWAALGVSVLVLAVWRIRDLWLSVRTLRRDLKGAIRYWRSGLHLSFISWRNRTVPVLFGECVARHPDRAMFLEGDRQLTFKEVDDYTNRLAHYFLSNGLKAGDDVALVMENRVDIVLFWLAMSKIGVVTALVNFNLRRSPLLHCIAAVNSRAVIFSPKLAAAILEIRTDLYEKVRPKFFTYGPSDIATEFPADDILPALEKCPNSLPLHRGSLDDKLLYIYTSGTTGMPKAAVIKHLRFIYLAFHIHYMMPLRQSDIVYICLPLYHIAGGVAATSQSVILGNTGVVVPKFSASSFWADCIRYRCTVAQYIGETCRYLYSQPPKPTDREHSIRLMFGNGLRPQIWAEFRARFGIRHIREFYGSTEGNANLMNIDDTVGSIGFLPTICRHLPFLASILFNLEIIRVDIETGVPIRAANGLCIRAGPGEPGEVVARIKRRALVRFDGYTDDAATSKKIYKDVFRKRDQVFSSGDVVVYDNLGYIYFRDRMGDTFRWRGENVSTAEVEAIISKHTEARDAAVFGVEVPGAEGRAGMAALLDPEQQTDLGQLLGKMRSELPSYAVPLFIRLAKTIELTSTFKLKKVDLFRTGYDISRTTDPIFFLDRTADSYVPLDAEMYMKIVNRQVKI